MHDRKRSLSEVKLFLVYTFSISWFFWLVIIISNRVFETLWYGELLTWLPVLIGALGPAISAYIIHRMANKSNTLKSFAKLVFAKVVDKKAWLMFVLFTLWRFLMVWIAFGIREPIAILYMFINLPLFILGGGFEEIGWRGFLQPKLEKNMGYLPSVLVVGIIWSIWHLPLWLIRGTIQSSLPFLMYTLMAIILSFSFTALYKYTKNIFLCVFSHAWFNGCIGLAVYIGVDGYLQLDLNLKVYIVFILELIVALIFGMKSKFKEIR